MKQKQRVIDGVKIPYIKDETLVYSKRDIVMYIGKLPVSVAEHESSFGYIYCAAESWGLSIDSTIARLILRKKPYDIPYEKILWKTQKEQE